MPLLELLPPQASPAIRNAQAADFRNMSPAPGRNDSLSPGPSIKVVGAGLTHCDRNLNWDRRGATCNRPREFRPGPHHSRPYKRISEFLKKKS